MRCAESRLGLTGCILRGVQKMGIRYGFVSTYPPTHCGIATFSYSLRKAITGIDAHTVSVVRLLDSPIDEVPGTPAPEIMSIIYPGDPGSLKASIAKLNTRDVALIQHEFGIFGGHDGDDVLTILTNLRVPSIVVLHTVLSSPTGHQREVMTEICRKASAVVTMSDAARERLLGKYYADPLKIIAIPHGAPAFPVREAREVSEAPIILTWGLIGPGKGIEWGIEALAQLRDIVPMPHYVVAGRTHPKVLAREGQLYREQLQQHIDRLGLGDCVELRDDYLTDSDLADLVSSASIVLLPYDSTEQVTSGVLIEAVAALRPVVATNFPHAVELLSQGVGVLVPHHDPVAIARALRRILQNPELAKEMTERAGVLASNLLWPAVATRYLRVAQSLIKTSAVA
jgi:glycosyltransferase involved in cell wall biosynthesis